MNEYIDKKQAIDRIASCYCMDCEHSNGILCRACEHQDDMDLIDDMPAVDVQPIRHGRWIETHISLCKWIPENEKEEGHNFYMAELKCSCCKRYNTVTFALSLTKPDFCQHCGARMDGEQND